MAQLKLMKKEWFNWFDKTFLDNITAWTEYYYINPDSQHWISNNLLDLADITETTINGITYKIKDGIVTIGGTSTSAVFINIPLKNKIPIGEYAYNQFTKKSGHNVYLTDAENTGRDLLLTTSTTRTSGTLTTTAIANYLYLYVGSGNTIQTYSFTPMLVQGSSIPSVFNPHLIKIEDILGVYNLGDLAWQHQNMDTEHDRFGSSSLQGIIKNPSSGSVKGYIFSNRFVTDTTNNVYNHVNDNSISISNNGFILVYSSEYSAITGGEFKSLVDGDYIVVMKNSSPY